jgi:hypothetical protein
MKVNKQHHLTYHVDVTGLQSNYSSGIKKISVVESAAIHGDLGETMTVVACMNAMDSPSDTV